jgi:hypothetical protein
MRSLIWAVCVNALLAYLTNPTYPTYPTYLTNQTDETHRPNYVSLPIGPRSRLRSFGSSPA